MKIAKTLQIISLGALAISVFSHCKEKNKSLLDLIALNWIQGFQSQGCPFGCVPGYASYGFAPGTPGVDPPGSGGSQCEWIFDPISKKCGATNYTSLGVPYCVFCQQLGPNSIGFDSAPAPLIPAGIVSFEPSASALFAQTGEVRVVFDRTMDPASVCLSGSAATEASSAYSFSGTSEFNDTLVIPPDSVWSLGPKTLTVKVTDTNGYETTIDLAFLVRDLIAEESAAETAIAARRTENASWGWGAPADSVARVGTTGYFQQSFAAVVPGTTGAPTQGRIVYSPGNGAFLVYGAILEAYVLLGGASGPLGPPTSDEFDSGFLVRRSSFVNGYIDKPFFGGPVVGYY
jgi:hypothetical protein